MKNYQSSASEMMEMSKTNTFHYKYRRRKIITKLAATPLLAFLCITYHLSFTSGFAPTHNHFNSVTSASKLDKNKKQQQLFASPKSDNEGQARFSPFFVQNNQENQKQQVESGNDEWNTQQMENEYSETAANNEQDYFYQQSSQATTQPEQQSTTSFSNSSPVEDNGGISSVDARVLESILADGKLDLNSEEEVKKLLEGPRKMEEFGSATVKSEEDDGSQSGKYNSKVISVSLYLCNFLIL